MTTNPSSRGSQTTTITETKELELTALEEKVVRMRHGLKAPANMELEAVGQDNPELAQKLAEMEQQALEAVGARTNSTKRRIVNSLKRKGR